MQILFDFVLILQCYENHYITFIYLLTPIIVGVKTFLHILKTSIYLKINYRNLTKM